MSAEPAKGKQQGGRESTPPPAVDRITVALQPTGQFAFNPLTSSVANQGTVELIAGQVCWVWTFVNGALANVFIGEQADHVLCNPGANDFLVLPAYSNATILLVGTFINSAPPPPPSHRTESLKGTIHVGF